MLVFSRSVATESEGRSSAYTGPLKTEHLCGRGCSRRVVSAVGHAPAAAYSTSTLIRRQDSIQACPLAMATAGFSPLRISLRRESLQYIGVHLGAKRSRSSQQRAMPTQGSGLQPFHDVTLPKHGVLLLNKSVTPICSVATSPYGEESGAVDERPEGVEGGD